MFLDEYQEKAVSTAIYPSSVTLIYPTLGLANEFGELIEKIHTKPNEVPKELGDVLWYIANVVNDLEETLGNVAGLIGAPKTRFNSFQQWVDNNNHTFVFNDSLALLTIKIGNICGLVKKLYRDDNELTKIRRCKILSELAWVLAGVSNFATTAGLHLTNVAEQNLKKLAGRKERGTLHGDGDDR